MKHKIFIGIDHPKHGVTTIELTGSAECNGWIAAAIERQLMTEAHPANEPLKPYSRRDMERFAKGEVKS
jgi:hypothetical protein